MKFFWILIVLPQFLFPQGFNNSSEEVTHHENIVKRVAFKTNDGLYPLTVLISPYGYLKNSEVRLGDNKYDSIDYLNNIAIGWKHNDIWHRTSKLYRFDTLTVDTIYSVFGKVMCETKNPKWSYPDNTIKMPDISSSLANEFKYTYFFSKLIFQVEHPVVLRVTYPISKDPFESNLTTLTMELFEDSISMNSKILDITDIFNITVEDQGNAILSRKHYRSLKKVLSGSDFDQKVVCYHAKDSSITDWDFVLEYIDCEQHYTYFLCSSAKYINNRDDRPIVRNFVDLFMAAKNFNTLYFGVGK